jgi:hypothetical protein
MHSLHHLTLSKSWNSTLREFAKCDAVGSTCEVVLGLSHIHPVAWQCVGKELAIPGDEWEGFLLNGRRPHLDSVQHLGAEAVNARIDLVAHEDLQGHPPLMFAFSFVKKRRLPFWHPTRQS